MARCVGIPLTIVQNNQECPLCLLLPTYSVKDRLAAYYYWNDAQALDQAVMVAQAQKINLKAVKRWSERKCRRKI